MAKKPDIDFKTVFSVFNEIGIINQLARACFERRLPRNLTVPHFSVINHLVRVGDGKSPLVLARAFQVPKTTMAHTISGLANDGLVNIKPNPRDGRGKLVYITKKGRQFREQAIKSLAPDMAEIANHFDFHKLIPLLPVLQELRETMDRYRDDFPGSGTV